MSSPIQGVALGLCAPDTWRVLWATRITASRGGPLSAEMQEPCQDGVNEADTEVQCS